MSLVCLALKLCPCLHDPVQDLTEPMLVMYEQPEEEREGEEQEENTFEVTEAIPDVELFGYKINTRSIHVLSGA